MCDTAGHQHGHHPHEHRGPVGLHSAEPGHEHGAARGQFRVVVTGKGGVGKTSLTAILARLLSRQSYRVLALDSDPQMNLPYVLGVPREAARVLVPLSQNLEYVEEKTGARPGAGWGLFLRLNPDVDDVVDRFGVVGPDGVRLLVMGTIVQPATGCLCPENSLLAAVANAVSVRTGEAILLDTQAGVEHFGRALAKGFHHAVVVTDPSFNGVLVALQGARLAKALGIPAVHLVVNRIRNDHDIDKVHRLIEEEGGFSFASEHMLPYDDRLLAAEPAVDSLLDHDPSPLVAAIAGLSDALVQTEQTLASCVS